MTRPQHIVNVSGGKDSECCYLLALERGRPFRAVMADTGNEHPWTYEQADKLSTITGGPVVEIVRADFSAAIERRRARLPGQWRSVGVPEALIAEALEILHPTGLPYLDLVLSKGMFASGITTKFCTEELKILPTDRQVVQPLVDAGVSVVQWLGIRADESKKRADEQVHPRVSRSRGFRRGDGGLGPALVTFRPLLAWKIDDVVAMHARHGVPMNPLYAHGMSRVGCFPCINERKGGMAVIARQFPEHVERIARWEGLVQRCHVARKKADYAGGAATFFPIGTVKKGVVADIHEVARWSTTARGGRQFDLLAGREPMQNEGHIACSDEGWCEA